MTIREETGPALRLCFVGDELVGGVGDPRALGWTGRVLARTPHPEHRLAAILPVPGETTAAMAERWEAECRLHYSPLADNRLVIGLGIGDIRSGQSMARSRLNLAKVLDTAQASRIAPFVVGPPPLAGVPQAMIAEFSDAAAQVCERREIPYVETFASLQGHDQWHTDISSSRLGLPGQVGYSLLAWLVAHCGWFDWLGVESTEGWN
ncbi:MAG: GDSL-type esterase/lipase family protein [Buchananella hordeovulneris]|nr:GDSL-type esterase/lipase family protein [Buchananella hordeovulneris]